MADEADDSASWEPGTLPVPPWLRKHPALFRLLREELQRMLDSGENVAAAVLRLMLRDPKPEAALKEILIARIANEKEPVPLLAKPKFVAGLKEDVERTGRQWPDGVPPDLAEDTLLYGLRIVAFAELVCEAARIAAVPIDADLEHLIAAARELNLCRWLTPGVREAQRLVIAEAEEHLARHTQGKPDLLFPEGNDRERYLIHKLAEGCFLFLGMRAHGVIAGLASAALSEEISTKKV
ncbi:MAG: hypothetical protein ACREFO_09195, partial [Acetobacteraceae bacterium]